MLTEQELLKQLVFLEKCIQNKEYPDNLAEYLRSESPKIRQLASILMISKTNNFQNNISFFDPSFIVRSVTLHYCKDIDILCKYLTDSNSSVRLAVIKSLYKMKLSKEQQENVFIKILPLINDKEPSVRYFFSKLLSKFTLISSNEISKMFDKEDIGTFVYGAEDENVKIRIQLVKSMRKLIKKETAGTAFNFLCDLLNDDSLKVQSICINFIYKITKNYTIELEFKNIFGLMMCCKSKNNIIKLKLMKILSNIKYKDIKIIPDVINSFNLTESFILLKKIVKKNMAMFKDQMKNKYFLFSNSSQRNELTKECLFDYLIMKILNIKTEQIDSKGIDENFELLENLATSMKKLRKDFIKQILNILKVEKSSIDNRPLVFNFENDFRQQSSLIIENFENKISKVECNSKIEQTIKDIIQLTVRNPIKIYLFAYRLGFSLKKLEKFISSKKANQNLFLILYSVIKKLFKDSTKIELINHHISLCFYHYKNDENLTEFRFNVELSKKIDDVKLILEQKGRKLTLPLNKENFYLENKGSVEPNLEQLNTFNASLILKCYPSNIKYCLGVEKFGKLIELSDATEIKEFDKF